LRQYLSKNGDVYLFRRRVPNEIVHRVGKREIYRSLGTTSVRIARQRLLYLFHGTEMLFAMGRRPEVTEDELARAAAYYLSWKGGFIDKIKAMPPAVLSSLPPPQIFREEVDEEIDLNQMSLGDSSNGKAAARHSLLLERLDLFLRRTGFADFEDSNSEPKDVGLDPDRIIEAVNREAQRAVQEQLTSLSHYQQIQQLPRATAGLRFSEKIDQFIAWREKARPRRLVKSGRASLTKQTLAQMKTTYRLFSSIMKDPVLTTVDRTMVQDFREALELLPSSHGKTNGKVSARPARTYLQELERKKTAQLKPITDKTIKRHFSALNQYFKFLQTHKCVAYNPFLGQQFNVDPGERRKWTKDELLTLFESKEYRKETKETARHWIPLIALFSGMRLEEIAHLRPQHDFFLADPVKRSGQPILVMQIAATDTWKPKTPAAEREIPVHSWLMKHGFENLVRRRLGELDDPDKRRESIYLFPELRPHESHGTMTASFSREFSRLKTKLKLPTEVTFHSFRHLFRSQLGVLNIPDRIIDALLGHQDVERKVKSAYEKFESRDLAAAVERFTLPMQNQKKKMALGEDLLPSRGTNKKYLDFLNSDSADDESDSTAPSADRRLSDRRPRQRHKTSRTSD
jgi:site-specific recombinase XerD